MEPRYQKIVNAVSPLLREGDNLNVSETNGHVEVRECADGDSVVSSLREDDPEFYGFLMSASYRINNATGCLFALVMTAVALGSCVLIHLYRPQFSTWWAYLLITITAVALWNQVNWWCEGRAYWSLRAQLLGRLVESRMSRNELIAAIRGDAELKSLAAKLMTDNSPDVMF